MCHLLSAASVLLVLLQSVPFAAAGGPGSSRPDGTSRDARARAQRPAPTGAARFPELAWLAGEWQGYGRFDTRVTYIHKSFAYDVAGRYLIERTRDMFPPEKPTTEFELHQDFTTYYRTDTGGCRAKGFFVEGYVWNSTVTATGDRIVVETDTVENAPAGMRARITYVKDGPDGLTGTFEIAMPGQDFKMFEALVMRRIAR